MLVLTLHILSQIMVICLSVKMGLFSALCSSALLAAPCPERMPAAALTAAASSIMGSGLPGEPGDPGDLGGGDGGGGGGGGALPGDAGPAWAQRGVGAASWRRRFRRLSSSLRLLAIWEGDRVDSVKTEGEEEEEDVAEADGKDAADPEGDTAASASSRWSSYLQARRGEEVIQMRR